jgi:hypothetical protein
VEPRQYRRIWYNEAKVQGKEDNIPLEMSHEISDQYNLTLATFNTGGSPWPSRTIKERYHAIGHMFSHILPDVINLQEIWNYTLLAILQKELPSHRYRAYAPGTIGPKAGLVSLSRFPLQKTSCILFPLVGEPPVFGNVDGTHPPRFWQRIIQGWQCQNGTTWQCQSYPLSPVLTQAGSLTTLCRVVAIEVGFSIARD